MKKIGKTAFVSTLALAVVMSCTAASMAMESPYETAAEDYARSIETLVETTGNAYENVTEAYPTSAINNPSAPAEYIKTAVSLGNKYMAGIFSNTSSFLGRLR